MPRSFDDHPGPKSRDGDPETSISAMGSPPASVSPRVTVWRTANSPFNHSCRALLNSRATAPALWHLPVLRKHSGGSKCEVRRSEKSANEIEDQTQGEGKNQHGNNRNINVHALAFVLNVSRQPPKPLQAWLRCPRGPGDGCEFGAPDHRPAVGRDNLLSSDAAGGAGAAPREVLRRPPED